MRIANIKLLSICVAILSLYPVNLYAQNTPNQDETELTIERVPLIQIKITGHDSVLSRMNPSSSSDSADTETVIQPPAAAQNKPTAQAAKTKSRPAAKAKGKAQIKTASPARQSGHAAAGTDKTVTSQNSSMNSSTATPGGVTTITNHTVNTVTYNITNNVITTDDRNEASSTSITMPVKADPKPVIRPLKTKPNIVAPAAITPPENKNDTPDQAPSPDDKPATPGTTVIVIPEPADITPDADTIVLPQKTSSETDQKTMQSVQQNAVTGIAAPIPVPAEIPAPVTAPAPEPAPAPATESAPVQQNSTDTAPVPDASDAVPEPAPDSAPAAATPPAIPAAPLEEQMVPQSNNGPVKNIAYPYPAQFDQRYMRNAFETSENSRPRMYKTAAQGAEVMSAATDSDTGNATMVKVVPETVTPAAPAVPQKKTVKTVKKKSVPAVSKTVITDQSEEKVTPYRPQLKKPLQPYGLWIKSTKGTGKRPTIIALHGCGGLYTSYGSNPKLTPRHETMARVFTGIGYNVLFPDMFMPRGIYGNCTHSLTEWANTSDTDRQSVEASLAWLSTQPDVDMDRIVFFGWSYGATVMLNALNLAHTDVAVRNTQPKAAIAFYPYCAPYLDQTKPYKLAAPTEIFVGENDTWTPAKGCERFEGRLMDSETQVNVFTYPDTYHDFDAPGTPIYVRLDVNPADGKPGGITAGGNSLSRAAAYKEILNFLKDRVQ